MDISQKELSKKDLLKTTGISYGQLYQLEAGRSIQKNGS